MTDWVERMSTEERQDWDMFVSHVRRDALGKIAGSSAFLAVSPSKEPDIQFAVELGLSLIMDKPLIVLVSPGVQVSEHLKRAADAIIEGDPDTEEGKRSLARQLQEATQRLGLT